MPLTNDGRQISAPSTRLRRVSPDPMATAAQKALSLYKTILRTGRRWPEVEHRDYIKEEAQRLFRANKSITNPQKIEAKLFEADARLEMALHYKTPYPRPYNLTKMATPDRVMAAPHVHLKSAHLHSHFDDGRDDL